MEFFNFVYDYVFIFQLLTVCAVLVMNFYPIKKTWKSILFAIFQILALYTAGTLLNWGLFEIAHTLTFLRAVNFPIAWLILIGSYLLFVKLPAANRILMGGTLFVTVVSMINLGRQLMMYVPMGINADFVNYVVCVFVVLFGYVLHKLSLKDYTDLPFKSAIMLLVITATLSLLLIGKEAYKANTDINGHDGFYIFYLIGFYIISACSYLMLYFYAKARKSIVQLQVENKLLEADKERIESFETAREEFHLLRHDFNNQMNILQIMLEKKDYEGLQNYFDSMQTNFIHDSKYDFIDCGNSIINSVVNMEILKAKRYNIEIKPNINVPNELPFETSDISRILVNLIDNSIEGLLRIEDEEKHVNCSILTHGEYLYIGVQNKINADAKPERLLFMNTEKEDQVNHGFGHRIVKKIAHKYNGHVNYSIEEDTFFAEVMLDLKYNKELN